MKMISKIKHILKYLFAYSECKKCNRFKTCDGKTWIHRVEDDCDYGKIHGE